MNNETEATKNLYHACNKQYRLKTNRWRKMRTEKLLNQRRCDSHLLVLIVTFCLDHLARFHRKWFFSYLKSQFFSLTSIIELNKASFLSYPCGYKV